MVTRSSHLANAKANLILPEVHRHCNLIGRVSFASSVTKPGPKISNAKPNGAEDEVKR